MRRLTLSVLFAFAACGDDAPSEHLSALDAALPDSRVDDTLVVEDAQVFDARVEDASVFVPPKVDWPAEKQPFLLSQVGLYTDIASKTLAPDLIAYEPRYALWSDGAQKDRHLRLPAGTKIDDSDPDHWQLPVGSVLFKEFRTPDERLETRVIARVGSGERDYFFGAFVWRDDESDAELAWDGASNVRGTAHDVPDTKQCGTCHNGEIGRVLGISAVQAQQAFPLKVNRGPYVVPGTPEQAQALGYLHANCAHCHNPSGSSRPDTDLNLRLSVAQSSVDATIPYQSSVGVKLQSFMGSDLKLRITAGDPEQSGVYFRMSERGPRTQMPPIATELADPQGMQLIADFIRGLPH
ncbi:MAG TPA: hypothetical protein VFX59_16275 [Polyangiales bacterium]|nr:hypothetical protein [Polyangiales bacterium]